jgi:transposase
MDRAVLERMLSEGLSLAEIGRRFDRHEATIVYWLKRHGLQAVGHARHAPRGGLTKVELAPLVEAGMSIRQIARSLGRGEASVRHWLQEYGLKTVWAERREASREDRHEMTLSCSRHGRTAFRLRATGGYRCVKCNSEAVSRRRRRVKQILVRDAGGACRLCGYNRCVAALEFHHVIPADKRFSLSHRGVTRSLTRAREEAEKCVLLCANCHAEVEAGTTTLVEQDCAPLQSIRLPVDHPG